MGFIPALCSAAYALAMICFFVFVRKVRCHKVGLWKIFPADAVRVVPCLPHSRRPRDLSQDLRPGLTNFAASRLALSAREAPTVFAEQKFGGRESAKNLTAHRE